MRLRTKHTTSHTTRNLIIIFLYESIFEPAAVLFLRLESSRRHKHVYIVVIWCM